MRKVYITLICLLILKLAFGQLSGGFNYQTIARNPGGSVISNTNVKLKISILQGDTNGPAVSVELFSIKTNDFGLINLVVGSQDPTAFSNINWSNGPYFIKVEMDQNGSGSFSLMGTSQLLSVPYALHSKTAQFTQEKDPIFNSWDKSSGITIQETQITDLKHFTSANEKDPIFSSSFASTIKAEDIVNWNIKRIETDPTFNNSVAKNITLNDIAKWNGKSFDGKYTSLTNIPLFHKIAISGNFNDLTNIPPNIISLSKAPIKGDILYFDGAKWVTLPIGTLGQILTIDISGLPVWK